MGENGRRMPRRYGMDGEGSMGRTWGGKLPEELGTKEQLLFAADNDITLFGLLMVDTLDAIREAGFRYEEGKLLSLEELAEQGIRNKGKYPEVYRLSLGEAQSRGETDRFWASESLNSTCRLSMDSAICRHFKDGSLPYGCLDNVLKEYGFDRVEWILANTIHQLKRDRNISRENREWSDTFHVPRSDPIGGSTWMVCVMGSPPETVEMAANMVRRDHVCQKGRRAHKPSIMEQLAAGMIPAEEKGAGKKVAERDAR